MMGPHVSWPGHFYWDKPGHAPTRQHFLGGTARYEPVEPWNHITGSIFLPVLVFQAQCEVIALNSGPRQNKTQHQRQLYRTGSEARRRTDW